MVVPPTQKELLKIEQSNANGATFIEAATSFVRIEAGLLEKKIFSEPPAQILRKSLAPREEFVLKLLLRRLSKSNDVLNGEFWALLAHLYSIIPTKALAHLLGEREFFRSLDEALERVLVLKPDQEEEHGTSSDEDSGRPTKKQRLRASYTRTKPAMLDSLVCKTITNLVQLATRNTESDDISCNAVRNILSASPEDAAVITGKLLQLSQRSLALEVHVVQREQLVRDIPAMLSIWACRRPDTAGGKSSEQCFTSHCLRPTLRLLAELDIEDHRVSGDPPVFMTTIKALERLVALHSILPLRSLFLTEKGQYWKAKTQAITWHDFKDLQAVATVMLLGPDMSEVGKMPERSFTSVLQYYSIAVRAVPRPTVRRLQQEQPWLDCLFCVCASMSNSGIPRTEHDEAGRLVPNHSSGLQASKILKPDLRNLLTLASETAVTLSLPVLLYITAAILEHQPGNEQWQVLAKILKQDVNVLIPNSGLLGSTTLLEKIVGLLSTTNNQDVIDYQLVRDGIIIPLLTGFAHARDLKGFVALWIRGLQDAIQQRASGDLQYVQSHLVLVWEDELLFQKFEDATKALTTSILAQSSITEMVVLLEQAATRIGPTSDIVSHVAVATSLLSTCPEDLDLATLESIITATASALSRRSDHQLQRWRFWRLLRQCFTFTGHSVQTEERIQQLVEKQHFVSLSNVWEILKSNSSYIRDARVKEALECFSLTVSRAAMSRPSGRVLLEQELGHLIALLPRPKKPKKDESREVQAQLRFALSCVAIVSQHPQVLRYSEAVTKQLVAAMTANLPLSVDERDVSGLTSVLKALLSSEEMLTNTGLFNDCCSELLTAVDEHGGLSPSARDILVVVPLLGLKKSTAEKFADILVQRLRSNATTTSSLDQILPDLGLLEMLVAGFSISVGKPKQWAQFIEIAEHILDRTGPSASEAHQIAVACVSKIFGVLWHRCQSEEMPSDMSACLLAFQARLRSFEAPLGSSSDARGHLGSKKELRDPAMSLSVSKATVEDLEKFASHINMQVSSFGSKRSSELAMLIEQDDLKSQNLLLMSAIICQTSAIEANQDQSLLQSMSKLATLTFAQKASTTADLCLALETCKIILEKHPSVVSQHTVDTLLSSITALTLPSTIPIASNNPSAIFDRLCSLLGLLLSRHRRRLGGRYHVILPALQGLLKCLFFAGTSSTATSQTKSQVIFIRSLPSWLQSSEDPLTSKSAEHFTRLLTTICDPSVSSVRRKKSNQLTDETKKAKSLAGQYMQYLIMDFCRCSLHGRIPSSSKEKLMPGLYAVVDVMDRETMRGMNGAMDSNGRAVWKELFRNWERFGRWDRR